MRVIVQTWKCRESRLVSAASVASCSERCRERASIPPETRHQKCNDLNNHSTNPGRHVAHSHFVLKRIVLVQLHPLDGQQFLEFVSEIESYCLTSGMKSVLRRSITGLPKWDDILLRKHDSKIFHCCQNMWLQRLSKQLH